MVAESKLEELKARTAALFENFSHELLEKWLEFLPKNQDSLPVIAQFLHKTKITALQSNLPPAALFATLELLRPLSVKCIKVLTQNYLDSERKDQVKSEPQVSTSFALLNAMSAGYTTIISTLAKNTGQQNDPALFSVSLHRAISIQFLQLLTYSQLHLAIPVKEWRKLHQLFMLAVEKGQPGFTCADDELFKDKPLTITQVYVITLLLGCSRLNHLTPKQINTVSDYLVKWAEQASVSKKPDTGKNLQMMVDIKAGAGPMLTDIRHRELGQCYFLQLGKLIEHMDSLLPPAEKDSASSIKPASVEAPSAFQAKDLPGGNRGQTTISNSGNSGLSPISAKPFQKSSSFDKTLVTYLRSAWSELAYGEERVETEEQIRACVGMDALHYYLAGGKVLKDFLGEMVSLAIVYEEKENINSIEQKRSGDIWSSFLSDPKGDLITEMLPPELNFQQYFEESDSARDNRDYPSHQIKMIDQSEHGCCLVWTQEAASRIEIGSLVGIKSNISKHWQVGEVRWVEHKEDGISHTGVRLLQTHAIPLGIDIPLRFGAGKNTDVALLLPPDKPFNQKINLLIRPHDYREGEFVALSQKGIHEKAKLLKLITKNNYFHQYECSVLVNPKSLEIKREK